MARGSLPALKDYLMGSRMTKADWVADKLRGIPYVSSAETLDANTLVVKRAMKKPLTVACAASEPVDSEEIRRIQGQTADADFVVVIPSNVAIAASAWLHCAEAGLMLGRFPDLSDGLEELQPNNRLMKRDYQFICRRIESKRTVQAIIRVSETALRLLCKSGKTFIADFTHPYEMTEDEVLNIISHQPDMEFLVVSNPYARGLSPQSVSAAKDAGVKLLLLSDFVADLGSFCRS